MTGSRRFSPLAVGVCLCALFLAANLIVMLTQGRDASVLPQAIAQRQPPIAGGAGLFVMPAQLGVNNWGCYLLDVDAGTLCVYQYQPQPAQLKLVAARDINWDRRLPSLNTLPPPEDIEEAVRKLRAGQGDQPKPATNP